MVPTQDQRHMVLESTGRFLWDFKDIWFVQTDVGNFVWSDPEYGGDNSFKQTPLTFSEFGKGPYLYRDKGKHNVYNYCGNGIDITLLETGLEVKTQKQ